MSNSPAPGQEPDNVDAVFNSSQFEIVGDRLHLPYVNNTGKFIEDINTNTSLVTFELSDYVDDDFRLIPPNAEVTLVSEPIEDLESLKDIKTLNLTFWAYDYSTSESRLEDLKITSKIYNQSEDTTSVSISYTYLNLDDYEPYSVYFYTKADLYYQYDTIQTGFAAPYSRESFTTTINFKGDYSSITEKKLFYAIEMDNSFYNNGGYTNAFIALIAIGIAIIIAIFALIILTSVCIKKISLKRMQAKYKKNQK